MKRKYYQVRAMGSTEKDFNEFFQNSIVAVGWREINLADKSKTVEEIVKEVNRCYYANKQTAPQVIGKKLNEVRRFVSIKEGDYIIVPFYSTIRIAVATNDFIHNKSDSAYNLDLSNQLKVEYLKNSNFELKTIPRSSLSEGLQRRLRVRGSSVSDLSEFADEIDAIFNEENYSWTSEFERELIARKEENRQILLSNIRSGKTNLQSGGIGLEYLVNELFKIEEYDTKVLPKTSFEGDADADVMAIKSDRFQETKILIQVKHHQGYSNDWGLHQLKSIKLKEEYKDCILGFITTAEVSEELRNAGEQEGIIVMDGNEFVEWLFDNVNHLKPETLNKLGIGILPFVSNVSVGNLQ